MSLITKRNISLVLLFLIGFTSLFIQTSTWSNASNDAFNNLGNGFRVENEPFIDSFADKAESLCPEDYIECQKFQSIVRANFTGNYPVISIISHFFPYDATNNLVFQAMNASALAAIAGYLIGFILFTIIITRFYDPKTIVKICSFLIFCNVIYYFDNTKWIKINEYILMGSEKLILFISILFIFLILINKYNLSKKINEFIRNKFSILINIKFLLFILLSAIILRLFLGDIQYIGFFILLIPALLISFDLLSKKFDLPTVFLLSIFIVTIGFSDHFFWLMTHPAPRGRILLISIAVLTLALIDKKSKIVWLIPLIAFFHVSVATLIFAGLFAMELTISILRRKTSTLLYISAFSFGLGAVLTSLSISGFGELSGSGNSGIQTTIALFLDDPVYLMTTILCGLCFIFASGFLLYKHQETWLGTCRVFILLGIVATLNRIQTKLFFNGYSHLDPEFSSLVLAANYLAPAVVTVGFLVFALEWMKLSSPEETTSKTTLFDSPLKWVALLVFLTYAVSGPKMPPQKIDKFLDTATIITTPEKTNVRNPNLLHVKLDDNIYYLQESYPKNNALIYLSLLKIRYLNHLGKFDGTEAVIKTLP